MTVTRSDGDGTVAATSEACGSSGAGDGTSVNEPLGSGGSELTGFVAIAVSPGIASPSEAFDPWSLANDGARVSALEVADAAVVACAEVIGATAGGSLDFTFR
jgi:hypothetical protein